MSKSKLKLGRIVATPGALGAIDRSYMLQCLNKHRSGDWGCLCQEDKELNTEALSYGGRIMSAYPINPEVPCVGPTEHTFWIITEADQSVTTFLLPEEY